MRSSSRGKSWHSHEPSRGHLLHLQVQDSTVMLSHSSTSPLGEQSIVFYFSYHKRQDISTHCGLLTILVGLLLH